MNPLFIVGEVVILQSIIYPHLNGECMVTEVLEPSERKKKDASGNVIGISNTHGYLTTIENPNSAACWHQSALRKKHQPGEQSFAELMQTLKSPVSV